MWPTLTLSFYMILINPASPLWNDIIYCFWYLDPPHLVLNVINYSSISIQLISYVNTILISFMITTFRILIIMLLISDKNFVSCTYPSSISSAAVADDTPPLPITDWLLLHILFITMLLPHNPCTQQYKQKIPPDCNSATQQVIFNTTPLVNICYDTILVKVG